MVTDAQNPTVCSAVSFYYERCIFHSDYAEHLYDFQHALLIWEQEHYGANTHVGDPRAEISPYPQPISWKRREQVQQCSSCVLPGTEVTCCYALF